MSKKFVKHRYPDALCIKSSYFGENIYIIRTKPGGSILKGCAKTEKEAWANLKGIIEEREKVEKGLTKCEIKARNKQLVKEYWESERGKRHIKFLKNTLPTLDIDEYVNA